MIDLLSINKKNDLEKKDSNSLFLIDKYLNFIIISSVILVFVAGYFLVIRPKYSSLKENEQLKKEKITEIDNNIKTLSNSEQLNLKYKEIGSFSLEKVQSVIPKYENIEFLISDLELIIKKHGLLLKSINIVDNKTAKTETFAKGIKDIIIVNLPKGIEYVQINMVIEGIDYAGLKVLLKAIENNQQLIDITNIDFKVEDFIVSISALAYYIK